MQLVGQKENSYPGVRARRVLSGLVFLALLIAQLAMATHQFDHPSTDIGDTCAECLLLARTGDAPVSVELSILPVAAASLTASPGPICATASPTRAYRQRGPPPA